jgi:hypothetical protein
MRQLTCYGILLNTLLNGWDEQAMIDYNEMEEEWEMDNYNKMQDGTK